MLDLKEIRRHRLVALALSRVVPLITRGRSQFRVRDDSNSLGSAMPFVVSWPKDVPRPRVGLVQDTVRHPYWTKYRRFLQSNGFSFRLIDPHVGSWLEAMEDLDILVWRPSSDVGSLEEARRKVFFLTEFRGLATYPTLRAISFYEDKILQYWALRDSDADMPETVVSFSMADAAESVAGLGSELVWKITTGSSSLGVERLSARRARASIRQTFSPFGRRTYWPYVNQKGYVYAQRLERELNIDMRILVIGPLLFGYYRDSSSTDFRASGMGRVRKEALPSEALEEAWRLARRLDVGPVALDFIVDQECRRRKVIEFSSFIEVLSSKQLVVDGQPGVYVRLEPGRFVFKPGDYWPQELALAEALGQVCGLNTDELLVRSLDPDHGK